MPDFHLPQNWLRAVAAGVEAALLSWLVPVLGALVTYVATAGAPGLGNSTWSSTVEVATLGWALAFGGRIHVEEGWVTLAPLGLTVLTLVLLRGAMRRLAVVTLAGAGITVVTFTAAVAALGLAGGRASGPHVAGALGVGLAAAVWALWGQPRVLPARLLGAVPRVPRAVRVGLDAAAFAVPAAMAAGALLVLLAVLVSWDQVTAIHDSLRPDVASAAILTLAQLLHLPNLALWALGWLSGPGVVVGTGTHYSAFGTTTELLPAIPVLGALPGPDTTAPWLAVLPVVIGLAVGLWRGSGLTRGRDAAAAAGAFLVASFSALALLGIASSGSIGPGRMAETGVDGPLVGIAVAGLLLAGYVPALVARLPAVASLARRLTSRAAATAGAVLAGSAETQGSASTPGTAATPASAATPDAPTAVSSPTALSSVSAATVPTALSPADGADPVR